MLTFPSELIASLQLDKKAVNLNAKQPFTYASGIKSPIYCDNRKLFSHSDARNVIVNAFIELLKHNGQAFDIIAGTATAGIPWATLIADRLNLPLIYVRSSAKEHGKGNLIEGEYSAGQNVLVIEDLISTGGSSFAVVQALRDAGLVANTCAAIFTYQMPKANDLFASGNCQLLTLTDFSTLINVATHQGKISEDEKSIVLEWNLSPVEWAEKYGFSEKKDEQRSGMYCS